MQQFSCTAETSTEAARGYSLYSSCLLSVMATNRLPLSAVNVSVTSYNFKVTCRSLPVVLSLCHLVILIVIVILLQVFLYR